MANQTAPDALVYDYSKLRAFVAEQGLHFDERALPNADKVFADLALTQDQVDALTRLYAWNMSHYFKPSTYTVAQRFGLAVHFLFGSR